MRYKITDRCKVWEINDCNKYAEVKFSCSRKVTDYDKGLIENNVAKNGYVSDYHTFVRFVGHAYHKLKDVAVGDTITNLDTHDKTREPYWDATNNCVAYPKNEKLTVFEFEKYEGTAQGTPTNNLDRAPQVAEEAPTATPQKPVAPKPVATAPAEAPSADDECPF